MGNIRLSQPFRVNFGGEGNASMSIIFPDFKDRKCLDAMLCGFMPLVDFPKKDQLRPGDNSLVAEYELSGRKVFIRLAPPITVDKDGDMHVHLDLSVAERWKKPPKANSTLEDIQALLSPLIGKKMPATIRGHFRVLLAELPPFIKITLGESIVNDVQVRMTEATLTVRGAPIHEISWKILEKESAGADVFLESRTETVLNDSYLSNGLDLLESGFRAFVIGETRSE